MQGQQKVACTHERGTGNIWSESRISQACQKYLLRGQRWLVFGQKSLYSRKNNSNQHLQEQGR